MNRGNISLFARRAHLLAFGVSAVAVAVNTSAQAQTEPYWLDSITVLATKLDERAIDSLSAISTLREPQLRELAVNRPAQLFTGMPGVSSEASAQDPGTAVNIRGLQDFGRVAVIVDGARQNFARAGHNGSGSFYLEPELLADVDVIRGPVANIYGSGAIGGVVSFRTKDVDDILKPGEQWGVATHGEIGSNKFSGLGSLFGAVRAGPNAEFIAGGTFRHQEDYKDGSGQTIVNSGQTVATGMAKATFRPAEGHEVKIGGIHYDADWINGIEDVTSVVRDSNSKNSTVVGSWSYSRPDDRLFDFKHSAYWNRVDVTTVVTWLTDPVIVDPPGPPPPVVVFDPVGFYGPLGNRAGYTIDTFGYDGHNTSRFDTGPFRHALTYGGDIFEDTVANRDPGGFGDGYNPSGKRMVWGGFAQLKSNYSSWLEVISALRYDNYSLNGLDSMGGSVTGGGDRVSPKITVGITPIPWLTFYGTYAEGYRAPAVTETLISGIHPSPAFIFLANPNLRPEVGKNKEFGINLKRDDVHRPGDKYRAKFNVFRNDVEDFIDTITIFPGPGSPCPAPPFCQQYQNVSQARIEGVELESSYDAGPWFVGLNAHRLRGKDISEGDPLAKVPPDMIAATFGVRSADQKYSAAVRFAHYAAKNLSDLPSGSTIEETSPSYNLLNLYLAYQPHENWIAALSVENLLDETYKVYTHEYNSPGITVKGSLRVRFAGGVQQLKEDKKKVN